MILAHSPVEGVSGFYGGLLHPLLVPAQLLLLVAWGLFWVQNRAENDRLAFFSYLVATAAGLIFAWFSSAREMQVFLLGAAVVIGLLVAANRTVGSVLCVSISAFVGVAVGMDSGQDELFGTEKLLSFLGCAIGLLFLPGAVFALSDHLTKSEWRRIGVRVLGSWLAAISLLVLALALSPMANEDPASDREERTPSP